MLFTFSELLDMVAMTFIVGYIFQDFFNVHSYNNSYFTDMKKYRRKQLYYSMALVAPSLILHELGHKFTALAFGYSAVFHAFYSMLLLGLILKLAKFPFVIFAPAYVAITGTGAKMASPLIALAGPATNLLLALLSVIILKFASLDNEKKRFFYIFKQINFLLFAFNMIPIPGFDGYHFFSGLF